MKTKLLPWLLPLLLLTLSACGTLDKSGPFKGDQSLYTETLGVNTAYKALDAFIVYEKANHDALLAARPEVNKFANSIRVNAPKWYDSEVALRSAYLANPTPENKASLQNILNLVNAALAQASTYLSQPVPVSK